MKALRFIVALAIIAGFAVSSAQSQAVVVKDQTWFLWHDGFYYESLDSHEVYCPDGTINIVLYFELDPGDPWIPLKGVNQFIIGGPYGDCWIYIHPNGKAKVFIHVEPI